jgi:hypothetical protein
MSFQVVGHCIVTVISAHSTSVQSQREWAVLLSPFYRLGKGEEKVQFCCQWLSVTEPSFKPCSCLKLDTVFQTAVLSCFLCFCCSQQNSTEMKTFNHITSAIQHQAEHSGVPPVAGLFKVWGLVPSSHSAPWWMLPPSRRSLMFVALHCVHQCHDAFAHWSEMLVGQEGQAPKENRSLGIFRATSGIWCAFFSLELHGYFTASSHFQS